MKKNRFFRILAIAAILSLLMLAIPATTVLAQDIYLSVTSGPTGTVITVTGDGFTASTESRVWFDSDGGGDYDSGEPYDDFMTDGSGDVPAGVTLTVPVEARGTYYVRIDISKNGTVEDSASFAITPEITLSVSSGNVGDTLTVSGTGFDAPNSDITIYFDGDVVTITSGDDDTNSYGSFSSAFVVPEIPRGSYTVEAEDEGTGNNDDTATFTVLPEITIDPTSGAVDDEITVDGTGFDANSDITVYFDGDEMTITGGDEDTNSHGSFSDTTFNVPEASRGSHTVEVEDEGTGNNSDTATFTVSASIALDPAEGSSGTTVTVTGTGFNSSDDITVYYNDVDITADITGDSSTDSDGSFEFTFTVPAGDAGTYEVEVTDGTNTATADFVSTTSATISEETSASDPGYVGMELTITGTGFTPDSTITVTYTSTTQTLATTDADERGNFEVDITIPPSEAGEHTITVSDDAATPITKTFTFYMESVVPPVPGLLLPLDGEKADLDAGFSWVAVVDLSLPVTYDLQIATDADFTNILVDRTGLTAAKYTLTEAEELESTGEDEPYYWRVRAVDAASNASEWSAASTFSVGLSFGFTGWVVYVTMAVIAVAFFFLGWWIGRRQGFGGEFA